MTDYPNKWDVEAISSNILGTDLDSKTDGTTVTVTSIFDNSDGQYSNLILELLTGTFGSATAAGGYFTVELFPSVDGTNYVDSGVAGQTDYSQTKVVGAATTPKRVSFAFDNIRPLKYKITILLKTGQTTPASGNTLKTLRYREKSTGP